MKAPFKVPQGLSSTFWNKIQHLEIDTRTKDRLIKDAVKIGTENPEDEKLLQLETMVDNVNNHQKKSLHPILARYYRDKGYSENRHINYFMKNHIDRWLLESLVTRYTNEKDSLYVQAKSNTRLNSLKLPREERQLPSVMELLTGNQQKNNEKKKFAITSSELKTKGGIVINSRLSKNPKVVGKRANNDVVGEAEEKEEILPLEFELPDNEQKLEQMDIMVRQVIKHMNFLSSHKYFHTRKLASPIVQTPATLLGEDIPEFRKKNLTQKKLTYIRGIFQLYPPIRVDDSNYLTSMVEDKSTKLSEDREWNEKLILQYKRFVKRTYTVDNDINIMLNKYAYIQPVEIDATKH